MRGIQKSWEELARESKSLRLIGFDADPGRKMPKYQNTAFQTALKHKKRTTVKTQTSWQLMEEVTHCGGLFIGSLS